MSGPGSSSWLAARGLLCRYASVEALLGRKTWVEGGTIRMSASFVLVTKDALRHSSLDSFSNDFA
jgi:hypothetical protein